MRIAALRRGIDLDMQVIDTAEMYGDGRSVTLVGKVVRDQRDRIYLVSKVLPSHASANGVVSACEASLKRLGVDSLDLYLLHWRGRFALAETLDGFRRLKTAGKIHSWGVSNFDVADMEELFALPGGSECSTNQVLYNLEYRGIEFDLLPWCEKNDVAVMAYSPVGQGGDLLRHKALEQVARSKGITPAQVALAWCMRRPVLAIPKAGTVTHVEQNAAGISMQFSITNSAEHNRKRPVCMLLPVQRTSS